MRATVGVMMVGLTLLAADCTAAEPAEQLPKDGAWARYHVITKRQDGAEYVAKITVCMAGSTTENGERCRWIEEKKEIIGINGETASTEICKVLISEKNLLQSENPLEHGVPGWFKSNDEQPQKRDVRFPVGLAAYLLFMPGPLKAAKPVEERRIVDYQKGRLEIAGKLTGRQELRYRATTADVVFHWKSEYSIWRHPNLPIGLAAARIKTVLERNGVPFQTLASEYTLEDAGTDAKSALPENN